MRQVILFAVMVFFVSLTACKADNPSQAPEPSLIYFIKIDPDADQIEVSGEWKKGASKNFVRVGDGDVEAAAWDIAIADDTTQFSYVIPIPPRRQENVLLASLNDRRFRAILQDILFYPEEADGPVKLSVKGPEGWTAATTAGDPLSEPTVFENLEAASYSPLLAGNLRISQVALKDGSATLAVRKSHPLPDTYFEAGFQALINEANAYTGGIDEPHAILFGIDLLEGKFSSVPGVNFATANNSASLVLQSNDDPRDKSFWGTISHEVLHGWIPRAFRQGDRKTQIPRWFGEGVTNHVGYDIAYRAGLIDQTGYLSRLEQSWREFSVFEFGDEGQSRAYSEGHIIGFATAALISDSTNGQKGFDDYFRALLDRYGMQSSDSFSPENYVLTALELTSDKDKDILEGLVSGDPVRVREAFQASIKRVGLDIESDGTIVIIDNRSEAYKAIFSIRTMAERSTQSANLNAILNELGPLEYPKRSSLAPASAQLTRFADGLKSPNGNAWSARYYGAESRAVIEINNGALNISGQTGPSFTGAGIGLPLGTADETLDLSGFPGIELDIDVREGPVVIQITSALVGRQNIPFIVIGATDGREKKVLLWDDFMQANQIDGWEKHATELQIMVRGQGRKKIEMTVYDVSFSDPL